tara:strand:+ start:10939 stop:11250 length:312 start_codon:yes stop_codon:yes gene_type:complete
MKKLGRADIISLIQEKNKSISVYLDSKKDSEKLLIKGTKVEHKTGLLYTYEAVASDESGNKYVLLRRDRASKDAHGKRKIFSDIFKVKLAVFEKEYKLYGRDD